MLSASWLAALTVCGAMGWAAYVRDARAAWKKVASGLRLRLDSPRFLPPRLRGHEHGFEIAVSRSKLGVVIRVLGVDPWFTLGRNSGMARLTRPGIETGDPQFDEKILVEGDRDLALGLLNFETRRAAEKIVLTLDGKVKGGAIEVSVGKIQRVPEILEPMLHLASLLHRPSSLEVPARLAKNTLEDPTPKFRLEAFRHLTKEFSGTTELRDTAKTLLHRTAADGLDRELHLDAAYHLLHTEDPEDRDKAAETLAEAVAASDRAPWLRRSALDRLVRYDPEVAIDLCRRLLLRREEPAEMRGAAITGLLETGALEELLGLELADGDVWALAEEDEAETLADGLGRRRDPRAQPHLIELLGHTSDGVRVAAARALAAVGDARAIGPLRDIADSGVVLRSTLARTAQTALEQIQRRCGGAQAGEISLVSVDPLVGAVSPSDPRIDAGDRRGEVSLLPDDPAGDSAGDPGEGES